MLAFFKVKNIIIYSKRRDVMKRCNICGKETCTCNMNQDKKPCSACGKPGCKCGMKKDDKEKKRK
jgi:hypothetical protein